MEGEEKKRKKKDKKQKKTKKKNKQKKRKLGHCLQSFFILQDSVGLQTSVRTTTKEKKVDVEHSLIYFQNSICVLFQFFSFARILTFCEFSSLDQSYWQIRLLVLVVVWKGKQGTPLSLHYKVQVVLLPFIVKMPIKSYPFVTLHKSQNYFRFFDKCRSVSYKSPVVDSCHMTLVSQYPVWQITQCICLPRVEKSLIGFVMSPASFV